MNIFKVISFAIKYKATAPLAIKFIQEIMDSVGDRKITSHERKKMMNAFWEVVKQIQQIQIQTAKTKKPS
jgi:hypothetical protein|tara:strand:- start:138 stop:347 length:210 start_codon:yes stop_codon:yes gene_type:complete